MGALTKSYLLYSISKITGFFIYPSLLFHLVVGFFQAAYYVRAISREILLIFQKIGNVFQAYKIESSGKYALLSCLLDRLPSCSCENDHCLF